MPSPRTTAVIAVLLGVSTIVANSVAGAVPTGGVRDEARAGVPASRYADDLVEYDVFGDSITAGFGVPAHLTWTAGVWFHLRVTQPSDVEHRFHNHAIDGQAIVTPSTLSVDPVNSSLVTHLRNFLRTPPRSTPIDRRTFVLTPSVNELLVSDQGESGAARVEKAAQGMRTAIGMLRAAGVPAAQIIVLPMPPVGSRFADAHDSGADTSVPRMIADLNAALADVLDVPAYGLLDPDRDGLADMSFYDGTFDAPTGSGPDGLHLDADGHARLAGSVLGVFRP